MPRQLSIIMAQIKLKDIYRELRKIENRMATKKEMESLTDTVEILSNPVWLKEVMAVKEAVKQGKVKSLDDVKKELGI